MRKGIIYNKIITYIYNFIKSYNDSEKINYYKKN